MNLADVPIGDDAPCFIVAELSCNHRGDLETARQLVDAAADAGASSVKFQLWLSPDDMTLDRDDSRFVLQAGPWKGRKLYDLYREAQTPKAWLPELFARARDRGMVPFASAFSRASVDFLETLDCPVYKVASPELPWLDLIEYMGQTGKPLILSTGSATWAELNDAVDTVVGNFALLHCVSAYPASVEDMNLLRMETLRDWFGVPVGLSDHSLGYVADIVAVTLGADIIEKHLMMGGDMLDSTLDGGFSLDPPGFAAMVSAIRSAEASAGTSDWDDTLADKQAFRRRAVAGRWVRCG